MKPLFLLLIVYFSTNISFSQTKSGINLNFNWSYIGENVELSYKKQFKNHSVYGGIKYHLNIPFSDNQNHVTKNRYYAESFIERFGLIAGYEYQFNINNSDLTPFVFWNIQFSDNRIYNPEIILPYGYSEDGTLLYSKFPDIYTNPMPVIDNNIGIGIRYKLYKNFYLSARAGVGIGMFYFDSSSPYAWGNSYWDWEVTTFFNIGLTYYFE